MIEQLERILESHLFRSSARCSRLLRYIIERTAAGDLASLKERTIGVESFARAPDYDTSQDPVVRSAAAELRKKLAQYYEEDAHAAEPRIRIVPGGYVAEFDEHANDATLPVPSQVDRLAIFAPWALVALAAILGGAVFLYRHEPRPRSDLDAFWAPVITAREPVVIFIEDAVAYGSVSSDSDRDVRSKALQRPIAPDKQPLPSDALIALPGQYVHMGEVTCLVQVISWLTTRSKPYRIVGTSSTSYSSVADAPALWITVGDKPHLSSSLRDVRFSIEKDAASGDNVVRDALRPDIPPKPLGASARWDTIDDYAVVTLIRNSKDAPVMVASSITAFGSSGIGNFLTSSEYFKQALATLPANWKALNTQIVLRVPIIHGAPGAPDVVATHTW